MSVVARAGALLRSGLPLRPVACLNQQQQRGLMTKELYDQRKRNIPKRPPWPYREKGYTYWSWYRDPLTDIRFDENTKLVIVEGNIGCGKSTLVKFLAEKFGLFHMDEFSMDKILVSSDGIDRREHYENLPKCYRWPDVKMFYEYPRNPMNAKMQDLMFYGKTEDYCNALAHIMNTGQGVIMERSVHSDFVFANAMRGCNYLSDDYFRIYHNQRRMMMPELEFWPHVVIYLDTPVQKCMENIKKRGLDFEVNSDVLDEKYLGLIEDSYKDLLQEYKRYAEVLVYDWEEPGDFEQIVEDLEKVELDFYHKHSGDKFYQWMHVPNNNYWYRHRMEFTNKWHFTETLDFVPKWDCEELFEHVDDRMEANVYFKHLYGFITPSQKPQNSRQWYNLLMAQDGKQYNINNANPWFEYWYKDNWHHTLWSDKDTFDYYGDMSIIHEHQ